MYTVRAMLEADVADLSAIELTTLSPWTSVMLSSELTISESLQFVAVAASETVVGWCCCRLVPPEAELLKITVDPAVRRSGVGGILFNCLRAELIKNNITTLFLEVRSKNSSALRFYRKHNFFEIGRRNNYYTNPGDDALILQYKVLRERFDNAII